MAEKKGGLHISQIVDTLRPNVAGQLTPYQETLAAKFNTIWADVPGALDTFNSFVRRPDCRSCRNDMITLMSQDKERQAAYIKGLDWNRLFGYSTRTDGSDELPGRDGPVHTRQPLSRPAMMSGEVRDIDDTPEAYFELIQEINTVNGRFTGLHVRELGEGRVRVYFY